MFVEILLELLISIVDVKLLKSVYLMIRMHMLIKQTSSSFLYSTDENMTRAASGMKTTQSKHNLDTRDVAKE